MTSTIKNQNLGFYISAFATISILIWLGIFKFTPSEAAAIQPLIANHPFTFWLYDVASVQTVSTLVGIFEIVVAILILVSLFDKRLNKIAGIGVLTIFIMTVSYMFTTPGLFKVVDGVHITDFFILKDLMYVGFGITLLTKN